MTTSTIAREHRLRLTDALSPDPGPVWDVHVLHSLPAGNPNRDRFQRPKEQTFGGMRRARISSQSLKRATRERMREALEGEVLGIRTRNVASIVAEHIAAAEGRPPEWDETAIAAIAAAVTAESHLRPQSSREPAEGDDAEESGEAIVFVSEAELAHVARAVLTHRDEVELSTRKETTTAKLGANLKKQLVDPFPSALRPIEAALTGRFFASRPDATIEAAVQVMHTLGIHPLLSETDFFSAVEERPVAEHAGAAHTGDADFNASCHYKYARVDVPQIALNLDPDDPFAQLDRARVAARAFVEAFIDAVPRAKQATMNAATPASFALIVRRRRGGWNLANAFVDALRSRSDLVADGVRRLDAHLGHLLDSTGDADLVGIDVVNRLGQDPVDLAPVATGWTPGSRPGQLTTVLDRLAPA
ncbi:MAG: type I-E CRISPR-associated protein Cas7/Cse4/CasC [Solirubrobacteraceae bacterium]